jgi:hypothetical protein
MEQREKPQGLCTTCTCFPRCTFYKGQSYPVLYCDEFTDIDPCRVPQNSEKAGAFHRISSSGQKEDDLSSEKGQPGGLCVNCGLKESCLFMRPEGGIWHCEEYC